MTQVGDVLKFTRFRWAVSEPNLAEEPFHAIVTELNTAGRYGPSGHVAIVGRVPKSFLINEAIAFNSDDDRWTVIEPENWPDDVCVAMAKRKLGVEP